MRPIQILSNAITQAEKTGAPGWLITNLQNEFDQEGARLEGESTKPLQFIGWQERPDGSRFPMFNTLKAIGDYPKHTTISGNTAKKLLLRKEVA